MNMVKVLPWVAGGLFVAVAFLLMRSSKERGAHAWFFPAVLALLFFAWSIASIVLEGPFGFWPEHTRNMWGNQIWFDLLLGIGIAWTFILPLAKEQGMKLPFWLLLILCTGSIGLLTMVARLLYLRRSLRA